MEDSTNLFVDTGELDRTPLLYREYHFELDCLGKDINLDCISCSVE